MKPRKSLPGGFTIVELLVTIAVVLVLAGLSFVALVRARERAEDARTVGNMRQIGSLLGSYAADNDNRLPPARADLPNASGGFEQLHWFEALLTLLYPDLEPQAWRNEEWWTRNKPPLLNLKTDLPTK